MDKKRIESTITMYLSSGIKNHISVLKSDIWDKITEIRITVGCPIIVGVSGRRYYVTYNGLSNICNNLYIVSEEDIRATIELMTHSSIYSYERYINDGYITLPGGNRVGIVGICNVVGKKVLSVNNIMSLNIRISHERIGAASNVIAEIYDNKKIYNTLIISPPGCGKTTMLRDIARILGSGKHGNDLIVCGIIDERFEISCMTNGKINLNIGNNNFVISGCMKSIAIPMVARSMSPDVIITDEMCCSDDYEAARFAYASGCTIIASVHGENEYLNEISNNEHIKIFERLVILSNRNGPGTVEKIIRRDVGCC